MAKMSKEAIEARRAYMRNYRDKNRKRLNAYSNQWQKDHPEKVRGYKAKHWQNVADAMAEDPTENDT